MDQRIAFAATAHGRVAFATAGSGPVLLCDTGWVSNLAFSWEPGAYRTFFERLAERFTLVRYDKPGTGLSDRQRADFTIEPEVAAIEAIVGELGLRRLSLLGLSQGGAVAAVFAARHQDLVDALVLYGTFARGQELGRPEVQAALVALVRASWGLGSAALADIFVTDAGPEAREWFRRAQQVSADAETAARLLEMNYRTDVSAELSRVRARTLVLHREHDRAIRFARGVEVASMIPGARLQPLPGSSHIAYVTDPEPVLAAIVGFLGEGGRKPSPLTPRELEVAALVAEGLTNAEIATRMGLAPKTVDAHVEHIRNKLAVRSRTQIGVWAAERRLLRPSRG